MEDNKSQNLDKKVKKSKKVNFKLTRISSKNLKGIDSRLIKLIDRVIKQNKFDFQIPVNGGLRSPQVQNNLFHQKKSYVDGFKRQSPHQAGKAFDVCFGEECFGCECDIKDFKGLSILFKSEFNLMKEEGLFEDSEQLIWGGDIPRGRSPKSFNIA